MLRKTHGPGLPSSALGHVERLGGNARGLAPWQSVELPAPGGRTLRVTATPAQHGPAHAERGPVVGFVLERDDQPGHAVYLSGDTVWFDGVAEVGRRFAVRTAVLFMGAARVAAVGPWHLTFTAAEGVEAARALGEATIVPVHFEDWEHFSESRPEIDRAFAAAGLGPRLRWLPRGWRRRRPARPRAPSRRGDRWRARTDRVAAPPPVRR